MLLPERSEACCVVADEVELLSATGFRPETYDSLLQRLQLEVRLTHNTYNQPHGLHQSCWEDLCGIGQGSGRADMGGIVEICVAGAGYGLCQCRTNPVHTTNALSSAGVYSLTYNQRAERAGDAGNPHRWRTCGR
jgi:hypothetical protein